MIIAMGFYKRAPGMSPEEFHDFWAHRYGPLYMRHWEVARHIRRYVQHHLSPNPDLPTAMPDFDGFSESWFDTVEDRQKMHAEPLYIERIRPLEARFIDPSATRVAAYDAPTYQVGTPPLPAYIGKPTN